MQLKLLGLALVVLSIATACSESPQSTFDDVDGSGELTQSFSVQAPSSLANARELDQDALFAEVRIRINGVDQPVQDTSSSDISFSAPDGSDLVIDIRWYERQVDGDKLFLASQEISQQVNGNTTIVVSAGEYDSSPYDNDNDSYSNFDEVLAGSDPFLSESTPISNGTVSSGEVVAGSNPVPSESTSMDDGTDPGNIPQYAVEVEIPSISLSNAPTIDGFYDAVYNDAVFVDRNLERLSINSLMIDQGAIRQDGAVWPEFELRWYALHDDVNLYVFVEGEELSISSSPTRDSTNVWDDDSIDLFFDGNNSKGSSYDQVDDRHLMIPLLTSPDDLSANSTVVVQGPNSAPISGLEFKTCVCRDEKDEGRYTWEIKVPLSDFGITKGVPFGFDIQMDLDHDGDARDARWAWFHPSRTTVDVNNTVTNPSFMGTVVIK